MRARQINGRIVSRGFTLIEVVVALAVAATGLLAVSSALSRSISVVEKLEMASYATWISSNRFAELRMSREFQPSGEQSGTVEFAGRTWQVVEKYYGTADPNIARIEIVIFHGEDDIPVHTDIGYLGRHASTP